MSTEEAHRTEPQEDRGIAWIETLLPHRYPFLFVDRVLELEPGKRIVAIKNFTFNEEFFQGHFPGRPVVPGVLLLEGMAQAGGIMVYSDMTPAERTNKIAYFAAIERARFRRPVVPGDQVRYEVDVLRWRRGEACRLAARALVGEALAAEAKLSSVMTDS